MKRIINHLDHSQRQKLGEVIRFAIVGGVATLIQYGVYLVMLHWTSTWIANTIAYIVSFLFNFWGSTRFTFRVKANAKRGAGFAVSHIVNYIMQMATLTLFIWVGVPKQFAPIPMFVICVPANFLLVRFFLKR